MPNLSKQFVAMMQRNKHQCLIRIEGMHNFLKDDNQFDELLQSGYTVQLDLQQLASKEKKNILERPNQERSVNTFKTKSF